MKVLQSAQLTDTEVVKYFINYLEGHRYYKRTGIRAFYMVRDDFYKTKRYDHVKELRTIIGKNGNKSYSRNNKFVKKFIYKGMNVDEILSKFEFLMDQARNVYLVRSGLFSREDEKISDLANKVKGIDEKTLMNKFEVIKYKDVRGTLKVELKTNKPKKKGGYNVYTFVVMDSDNTVHVGVPFALTCPRQFSRRGKGSVIKKFVQYNDDGDSDELIYYINSIYDHKNNKFKDTFNFVIDFYSEQLNEAKFVNKVENEYPSPIPSVSDKSFDGKLSPNTNSYNYPSPTESNTESNDELKYPFVNSNNYPSPIESESEVVSPNTSSFDYTHVGSDQSVNGYMANNHTINNVIPYVMPTNSPYICPNITKEQLINYLLCLLNSSDANQFVNGINLNNSLKLSSIPVTTGIDLNNNLNALSSILVTAGIDLNNNLNALSSIPVTAGIDLNNNLNALSSIPVTAGIDLNNNLNALSSIPVTAGIDLNNNLNALSSIPVVGILRHIILRGINLKGVG
ncbi:hypothetical protein PIROE2DRAFT_60982 [Piromyces sp. E2]|nr:hypothetical protein PIROE2DRAFT_60982 [Piromyces sp. E2]|eukprot:OUM63958.1 hypothetical protein PIROE2DRAFT_60982 [Piromyces sp. E2]